MTKTDEAFQEAVLALRDWIDFLDARKNETRDQLERAKRRAEKEPPDQELMTTRLDEDGAASPIDAENPQDKPDSWM
ncbi:MAG TPA: hypothetical protein PLV64_21850 [Anaerolineales bacterium]|jgi:hypothetical protein|nr:hypothetical protein [Anaerolineales bacterium]